MELTGLDLRFPAVLTVGLLVAVVATYRRAPPPLAPLGPRAPRRGQLGRADRPAGVPPRAARPPHPDGRAGRERAAARRGRARRRGAPARHDRSSEPQTRNRDIMLCLDISGSMAAYDAELVSTFKRLVTQLPG